MYFQLFGIFGMEPDKFFINLDDFLITLDYLTIINESQLPLSIFVYILDQLYLNSLWLIITPIKFTYIYEILDNLQSKIQGVSLDDL